MLSGQIRQMGTKCLHLRHQSGEFDRAIRQIEEVGETMQNKRPMGLLLLS